jgi:glycosyltransferase involved in cell wall biosynthesis
MKILYISYDGMTDPLGQSQVIPYLAGLASLGHEIQLISCEKKDRFALYNNSISKLLSESKIKWHPVSYSSLPSMFSKQFNLYGLKKKAVQICRESLPDVVHCRSYMAALIGLKLKQNYGLKFIFDMRGFWADERVDGGIWDLKKPLHKRVYRFFKKKEIEFLLNADYTISLTQNAKEEILSWKSLKNKAVNIDVIPCCADLQLFSATNVSGKETDRLQKQMGISAEDFILTYLGSIGTWYMLDEMLDFFSCLLKKNKNSKFLIITPDNKDSIYEIADAKKIPRNKLIITEAQRQQVPLFLSLTDISIYFIRPAYSKKASSPTKTAEIMGMGIPLITNTGIGDSDKIISESGAGILIKDFSNDEYIRAINEIDVTLKKDPKQISSEAQRYFSLSTGIELYNNVYKKLNIKKRQQ